MTTNVVSDMLSVVKAERDERLGRVRRLAKEDANAAYDQWQSLDMPFIAELCFVLLVAIRHQVERELVWLAARAEPDAHEMESDEYLQHVKDEWQGLKRKEGWKSIESKLQLGSVAEWGASMGNSSGPVECWH